MPDSQLLNSGILRDVEDTFEPMMERFRTSSLWEILIPVKDCDMEDVSFFFLCGRRHWLIIVLGRKKSS